MQIRFFAFLIFCAVSINAHSSTIFFAESGNAITNDDAFQAAVNNSFFVQDFDSFANNAQLTSFSIGPVTATVTNSGQPIIDSYVFQSGAFTSPHSIYNKALVAFSNVTGDQFTLEFSEAVLGFGFWLFDDGNSSIDSYRLSANGGVSSIIDANPGLGGHIIEGFLGVVDTAGITSITVQSANGFGSFEVDNLQLATMPVPEPSILALIGLGLVGLGFSRRLRNQAKNQL